MPSTADSASLSDLQLLAEASVASALHLAWWNTPILTSRWIDDMFFKKSTDANLKQVRMRMRRQIGRDAMSYVFNMYEKRMLYPFLRSY